MISIIVPVYNVESCLERCVNSLVNQKYKDIEIILVDDGSTDGSAELCDKLQQRDERIYVIHKENGGLSSARNAGINVARGDYYAFVDSDDFVERDMYETMYEAIKKSGKDIASCGRFVDIFGEYCNQEFTLDSERIYSREDAMREILFLEKIDVAAWDKLYKKKLFQDIRYPEGKISEDAAVIFDILEKSNGIIHVGKPLYHYVFRKNSITKSKYSEKKHDVISNLHHTETFLSNNHPNLMKEYEVYCAINVGGLLLDMEMDPGARKNYSEHYAEYRTIFYKTVKEALRTNRINKKMKIRLFALKTHTIKVFFVLKKIYTCIRRMSA